MTMFASHAPGEVIDAIRPDLEAFTSLWTALRVNYEGTNITRTVARLLHMYQPEEGVIAYERLLRTLFVLLEDFDSDGLQLLVSMVPPPKGVPDDIIREVFNRATGFTRVDAPIFHKNTDTSMASSKTDFLYPRPESRPCSSSIVVEKSDAVFNSEKSSSLEINKDSNPTAQNDNNNGAKNRMKNSPHQTTSQESSEVFRGFPPSEIFNTQTHVQSIKNFYRPSTGSYPLSQSGGRNFINFGQIIGQNSGQIQQQQIRPGLMGSAYRPKWFPSPSYLIQKNSYPVTQYHQDFYWKTVNNQYVKVPVNKVNDIHQANVNIAQGSYKTLYNNPHDYLRNRSNTVTSGLLEKLQRHRSLQEAAIKKILLTDCEPSKTATILSTPRVPDPDIINSQKNVGYKIIDLKVKTGEQEGGKMSENLNLAQSNICVDNSKTDNFAIGTCNLNEGVVAGNENEESSSIVENNGNKIHVELESAGKNHPVNSEDFEEFTKEVRMRQRAIQEDIFKMDVVQAEIFPEEDPGDTEETDQLMKPELLTPSEELRNSCKKFIDRTKTEEIIEVPPFPKTRGLNEIRKQSATVLQQSSESNLWRLLTSKNISEKKTVKIFHSVEQLPCEEVEEISYTDQPDVSVSPVEIPLNVDKELSGSSNSVPKRVVRKKKQEAASTKSKNHRLVQKGIQEDLHLMDRGSTAASAEPDVGMRSNSLAETTARCQLSTAPQTATSSSIGPATTMAELAAYKKQYYDALLSIQKAEAAVANSLAISSVRNSPSFDPYYYNYLQQQQQQQQQNQILQRRQHQILLGQSFSQRQSLPPQGTPWFGTGNWRYPVITPARLPQRPQMIHPSSSIWPPGVAYNLVRDSQNNVAAHQRQTLNVVQVPKPPIKRRKLEEIVGKLKETENNGSSN